MPSYTAPPFCVRAHITGNHSLTEDALASLWYRLIEEGSADALFYDGGVCNVGDFINFMSSPDVYCYAVYAGNAPIIPHDIIVSDAPDVPVKSYELPADNDCSVPLAFTWLNNFCGKAAMIHFAVFKAGRAHRIAIGRFVVEFLLCARSPDTIPGETAGDDGRRTSPDSGYCLDALYGMTPAPYAHVLHFIRRLGFVVQGTIPGAVRMLLKSERTAGGAAVSYADGVISVCTRATLADGPQAALHQ